MRKNPSSPIIRQRAKELRQDMTPAESALWKAIRGRKLKNLKFRRQHPIGQFIADFYCADYMLIVEVDGSIHEQQVEQDQARTEFLNASGYKVIRFSNEEILDNLESVLTAIADDCG